MVLEGIGRLATARRLVLAVALLLVLAAAVFGSSAVAHLSSGSNT